MRPISANMAYLSSRQSRFSLTQMRSFDDLHSSFEDRFITIGRIADGLALVVWTERADGAIHIISARWATKGEARRYHTLMERRYE
jgi:uncharacterized DUF497 family protein